MDADGTKQHIQQYCIHQYALQHIHSVCGGNKPFPSSKHISKQYQRLFPSSLETMVRNIMPFNTILLSIPPSTHLPPTQCYTPATYPLITLMHSNIKCKLSQQHVHGMMLYGYVLLLLSIRAVDKFLQWATTLYQQQSYTHTQEYNVMVQHMIKYNNEYNSSDKGMHAERKKEYHDANIIKYVHEGIKGRKASWNEYRWEERRGELIGWQHPFHALDINERYSLVGIEEYMLRGQVGMCILSCLQAKNRFYNILDEGDSKQYLKRVCVISNLHKNEYEFATMPSLLQFYSFIPQLCVVQMQMGIDVEKCISNTQHLREDDKQQTIQEIRSAYLKQLITQEIRQRWKQIIIGIIGLQMERKEVKWMRAVGRRCNHHQQSTTIRTRLPIIILRMDLLEDQTGRKTPIKGGVVEKKESGMSTESTCTQMHIGMKFMLNMGESMHYEQVPPARKVFVQLPFLMKHSGEYVLDIPSVMRDTIPYKGKHNQKKLRVLSRLHMSDQKVSRLERCWNTLKEELNEQDCVLLQYKHKAPRYQQVPEWYTKYWEEQKKLRQQKRQQYKAELDKRIEQNKQIQ